MAATLLNLDAEHPTAGTNKRLSIERIYQRKTQLEHILLRPDSYVGSVEETTETMYVFDSEKEAIVKRSITFVPGLYKIFDEILVNAADNKQRDKNMTTIKISIDAESNTISVWNNGCGIPVEIHDTEKVYVPELIFGTLLTSSNYDDEQKKVTGGRNGFGAKLCNIFSTEFTVETGYSQSGKTFKMTWKNNMGKAGKTIIKDGKSDFTKVTFKPDLAKFKMTHLTADMEALMARRAYDLAGCTKGVSVYLNGKKLPIKSFRDYVELYLRGISPSDEEDDLPRKVVYEVMNPRWEVAVTASPNGFQQASFVNSIATTKGGTHVNYVVDQVVSKLLESAKKKNKGGMDLKPFHIKGHLWVFINCLVENPSFDSQTKENMTLKARSFGSACSLSDKFIKQALGCGVVDRVLTWARAKSQAVISKKQSGSKHTKLRGIPKLDDANEAGTKNSLQCTLIVTEGDSAKTLAVSGLGVIGRDYYGAFPLRGKLLNVREATHNQIMGNEEITNLVKILGLNYSKKYDDPADLRTLRYGRLMIMADQDQDGSHIKGLVINFVHHNWPNLLKHNFIEEFITPIVKVSKGRQEFSFYSLPEFEQWKDETDKENTWKVKYYKGLGTSTSKEAKEYFSDMDRHRIMFCYSGNTDDDAILLAFSKKKVDQRKEWLTSWLQNRRERRANGINESLLYATQTDHISFAEFVNKELILFSNMDNERSIPSIVDGLKPGQRKVMYTCFKRNDKKEVKVAQLAGSVAEHSAYHHGEQSLMSTIINLAQDFVGSNNINLLQPIGQFGTRLHGGKDAASPRYIFTMLSSLAKIIFNPADDSLLTSLYEDNLKIEPEWYCPILPLVLVNGSDGIGTGYSTNVPNYNPREIVANIKRMMNGMEPTEMQPWYKNFMGSTAHVEPSKYTAYGKIARLSATSVEITELPIRAWTQTYKENVLEVMLHGTEKIQPFITDYKEYHTDTTVRFVVTMTPEKLIEAQAFGFHKKFKLESSVNISNLVLFDHNGCLKRYSGVKEIISEFFYVRLDMYRKRKQWLEGQLGAEAAKLTNQARFIMEKIEGKIIIENKRKVEMIDNLKQAGYRSDPVKAWKKSISDEQEEESEESDKEDDGQDYNYLLSMQLWSLTKEKKDELLKNRDTKIEELRILKEKTPKDLWNEDLEKFLTELDQVEAFEREEKAAGASIGIKKSKKTKGKVTSRQITLSSTSKNSLEVTKPSPFAENIAPVIPEFNSNPKAARVRPKNEPKEGKSKKKGNIQDLSDLGDDTKTEMPVEKKATSFGFSDSEDEDSLPKKLADRIKTKQAIKGPGQPKAKQTKLVFAKGSESKAKENIESDSDSSDSLIMDVPTPPVREKRAVKRTNYASLELSDSEESSVNEIMEMSDSEDDFQPMPRKTNNPKLAKSKPVESLRSEGSKKTVKGKLASVTKATSKSEPAVTSKPEAAVTNPSSQSDEENEGNDSIVGKPIRNTRRPNTVLESDTSDEESSAPPPLKKQAIQDHLKESKTLTKPTSKPPAKKKPLSRPKITKALAKKAGSQKTDADAEKKQSQVGNKRAKPQTTLLDFVDSRESEEDIPMTKRIAVSKNKAPPSKPVKAKSKLPSKKPRAKVVVISSDNDDEFSVEEDTCLVPAIKRPVRDRKQAVKYHESDDEESGSVSEYISD